MISFRFIDLFAGIGGFRIALESIGGTCVFTSEWDRYAATTYETNFGETPFGDITAINEASVPEHEVLCAGFPCQAFSISGSRKGFEDSRGTLFFDVARIAAHRKPRILFLENVKNFATHDHGRTIATVLRTLDEIGYHSHWKILNASYFGAPTSRQRIYIIATRKDLNVRNFEFPEPSPCMATVKDIALVDIDSERLRIKRDDITFYPKVARYDQFAPKPIRIGTINKGGQGERIYSASGHAITFSAYGGGAAGKTGAYLIDGVVRRLAPRECARVMGFPDEFQIPVSDVQAWKQFGNSVAVPVLNLILHEIQNQVGLS